jgi:sporulation protein YlmC with PRC-barrel domain
VTRVRRQVDRLPRIGTCIGSTTEGTTTTQTEETTTTTEPAQTETTTQPVQTETTTEPAEGEQMEVQTQPAEGQPVPGQMFQQSANQFLGSTLMDATVQSTEGENIGEVNDIVVNSNGTIEGVVIGVGGFLGIGERDVAVRLDQITIQQQEGDADDLTFVLNATREELEDAPPFQTQEDQQAEQAAQDAAAGAGTGAATGAGGTVTTTDPAAAPATTDPAAGGTTTTTTTTEQPAEGQQ